MTTDGLIGSEMTAPLTATDLEVRKFGNAY